MTQYLRDSNRSENSFTEFTKLVSFLIRDYSKLEITFIAFHWKNLSSNFDNTLIISEILIFISEKLLTTGTPSITDNVISLYGVF